MPTADDAFASGSIERLWLALAAYHRQSDDPPLSQLSGLWTVDLGDGWTVMVNGLSRAVQAIPPATALVECDGWPLAMCTLEDALVLTGVDAVGEATRRLEAMLDAPLEVPPCSP